MTDLAGLRRVLPQGCRRLRRACGVRDTSDLQPVPRPTFVLTRRTPPSGMMMYDGISVGSGSFGHLPPSNVVGLAATLTALHGGWGGCAAALLPCSPPARCEAGAAARCCLPLPSARAQRPPPSRTLPPAVGRSRGWGLAAVWWALCAFYATRLAGHLLRYWSLGGGVFAGSSQPGGSGSGKAA